MKTKRYRNFKLFFGLATLETFIVFIYLIAQPSSDKNVYFLNYSVNKIILLISTLLLLMFFLFQTIKFIQNAERISNSFNNIYENIYEISHNKIPKILLNHIWFLSVSTIAFLLLVVQFTTDMFIYSILVNLQPHLLLFLILLIQAPIIFYQINKAKLRKSYSFMEKNRTSFIVLFLIFIIGITIRSLYISQPIRLDESITLMAYASDSLWHALSTYSAPNNHVFHSLLVNISLAGFGNYSLLALRLPAFIFGILIIPVTFITTSLLFDQKSALLSSALVSSSSFLIEYSTLARGYSLICLLTMLLILIAIKLSATQSFLWHIFALLSAIGFLTTPIMLFPFGSIALWILHSAWLENKSIKMPNPFIIHYVLAMFSVAWLTTLFYMPIILVSGVDSLINNSFIQPLPWDKFFANLSLSASGTWRLLLRDLPGWIKLILYLGVINSLITLWKIRIKYFLPLSILIWCSLIIIGRQVVPFPRMLIFILPIFFMYASNGIIQLFNSFHSFNSIRSYRVYLSSIVLLSVGLSSYVITSNSIYDSLEIGTLREAEQIVLFLNPNLKTSDVILAQLPSTGPLEYYLHYYRMATPVLPSWDKISLNTTNVYIVVNIENGQTISSLINKVDIPQEFYEDIQVVKYFEYAQIYRVEIR